MEQTQVVARGGGLPMQWLRGGRDFLVAVRHELGKVSWPTQEELVKATKMVVILSAIIGVALGLLDLLLTTILLNGVAALAR
jgi:preprotein translocase SecE subunit